MVAPSIFGVRVRASRTTVGVIVRVDRDSFRVLDQNGTVRTVKLNEIHSKRDPRNAKATDKNHNQIGAGDLVQVVDGQYKVRLAPHVPAAA